MLGVLPPTLPTSGGMNTTPTTGIRHAQNLQTTKLQQRKDQENASVSVGQASMRRQRRSGGAVTSVARLSEQSAQGSAVSGMAKHSVYDEAATDDRADARRYRHIRKLMLEKRAATKEAKKMEADAKKGIFHVQSQQGAFRKSGAQGFHKRFRKALHKKKHTKYRNLSEKDKDLLEDIIMKQVAPKKTGKAINRLDRKRMRRKSYKAWKNDHKISREDFNDFKDIIGGLE